jgi:DNA repair protein RadC
MINDSINMEEPLSDPAGSALSLDSRSHAGEPAPPPLARGLPIPAWPVSEQPRVRLLKLGARALSDAELLAVCLGSGDGRHDGVTFARLLLREFGGLRALLHAPPARLARVRGLGPARIAALKAVLGLAQRHAEAAITDRPLLTDTVAVRHFLQQQLAGYEREVFACLFLDTRHHLIGFEMLFFGSVDRASVHPREVLKQALACNAAAVVLAHNHPSGNAEPSPSDVRLTEELRALLMQVDVRVLDHVVVGHGSAVSLAERGLI